MNVALKRSKISVKPSPIHGFGVFAEEDLPRGVTIEECYLLASDGRDPFLANYFFGAGGQSWVALGYGSIYNHSKTPNAIYKCDPANKLMTIKTNRAIRRGEEIYIYYGKSWFSMRQMQPARPTFLQIYRQIRPMLWRFFAVVIAILLGIQFLEQPSRTLEFFHHQIENH